MDSTWTATALWGAVIGSGVYHGVNPGMGWPLAVSAALMERRAGALGRAVAMLAAGHFLAMCAILLPFGAMTFLVGWERGIRIVAGAAVIGFGAYLLFDPRHPLFLARVSPTRLALWSFLAALAHGAALMLVPIYLGICQVAETDPGHRAAGVLMTGNAGAALLVACLHTAAMALSGGAAAYAVHRWFGLQAISRSWFNLDRIWAISLILVGGVGLAQALRWG